MEILIDSLEDKNKVSQSKKKKVMEIMVGKIRDLQGRLMSSNRNMLLSITNMLVVNMLISTTVGRNPLEEME